MNEKLYLIVFAPQDDGEVEEMEWFFKVLRNKPSYPEAVKMSKKYMLDEWDREMDIASCYVNEVYKEDGFKIKLEEVKR